MLSAPKESISRLHLPPASQTPAAQSLPPATGDGASGMPAHLEVSVVPVVMHHKT